MEVKQGKKLKSKDMRIKQKAIYREKGA